MKNKYIFSIACALLFGMNAPAQLLNAGFENWTAGNPDNWESTNSVDAGMITTAETTDRHGGAKAASIEVISFFGNTVPPFLQAGSDATGFSVNQAYTSLTLYYKFAPVGGDRFSVDVYFSKNGSSIASGAVSLGTSVSSYTALTVPVNYFVTDIPDTVIVQISIIGPNSGTDYHVGSKAFVDDLTLGGGGPAALTELLLQEKQAYPNPTDASLNIPLEGKKYSQLRVYDLNGKEIQKQTIDHNQTTLISLDLSQFEPGIYFYELSGALGVRREKIQVIGR